MTLDDLKRQHASFFPRRFEFECHEGWSGILAMLFADLEAILPLGIEFKIVQIKEKFGGLRVYRHVEPKLSSDLQWMVYRLTALAEARSFHTCERCGRSGRLWVRDGFYFTACNDHADCKGASYSGRRAEPVEGKPYYERFEDHRKWFRYDPELDDFVPCLPPDGFEGG